jgi:hypothetical protein
MKIAVTLVGPTPVPLPHCDGCARDTRLVGIETDFANAGRDIHTFECAACNELLTRTIVRS